MHPVLINGEWRPSRGKSSFQAINPACKATLPGVFPVSSWEEIREALQAAHHAFETTRYWPGSRFADFLFACADYVEARGDEIIAAAHLETALPVSPRLRDAEFPRTINQLRQAAQAAKGGSWRQATIDTANNIRSFLAPIGPVAVFGPNNFPFAFNSIAGGDFAAAVAAGNPVIAKGHSSHPDTTRLFGEAVHAAAVSTGMPPGFVQLIYRTSHEDGARLVAHPLIGASGYTGARNAGLLLKGAADLAGKPFYAELSSVNPTYFLPGALEERFDEIVTEYVGSALLGAGQFCTNPGFVVLKAGKTSEDFISAVATKFQAAPVGTLLGEGTEVHLRAGIVALQRAGATVVTGAQPVDLTRYCHANTLLRVSGSEFLKNPEGLQSEAFGNAALIVVAANDDELEAITRKLEGSLTGCIYSSKSGADDALYNRVEAVLRYRVGRLLNDKMPTGVTVSPAMNHGGPFPSTGHPGFTSVGIPASLRRFAVLQCYDNVRNERLPKLLQDENPDKAWRLVDSKWTEDHVVNNG